MILRVIRKSNYTDKLRHYKIFIDDVYSGKISENQTRTFDLEPGKHSIYAKIDWGISNTITFDSVDGDRTFEVGPNVVGLKRLIGLLYVTLLYKKYLFLKEL